MKTKRKITRRKRISFNIYAGILINRDNEYVEIFAKSKEQAERLMFLHYPLTFVKMIYKVNRYTDTTLKKIKTIDYRDQIYSNLNS